MTLFLGSINNKILFRRYRLILERYSRIEIAIVIGQFRVIHFSVPRCQGTQVTKKVHDKAERKEEGKHPHP